MTISYASCSSRGFFRTGLQPTNTKALVNTYQMRSFQCEQICTLFLFIFNIASMSKIKWNINKSLCCMESLKCLLKAKLMTS